MGNNLNLALNTLGGGNHVPSSGNLNAGFNALGDDNTFEAGPGHLALAGSILRNGQSVTKTNFGIAINNFRIGGAAAARVEPRRWRVRRPRTGPIMAKKG